MREDQFNRWSPLCQRGTYLSPPGPDSSAQADFRLIHCWATIWREIDYAGSLSLTHSLSHHLMMYECSIPIMAQRSCYSENGKKKVCLSVCTWVRGRLSSKFFGFINVRKEIQPKSWSWKLIRFCSKLLVSRRRLQRQQLWLRRCK